MATCQHKCLIFLLIHVFLLIVTLKGIDTAEQKPVDNDMFKTNKLNLLWTKAQHKLGQSKLKDLKNELLKHEPDEIALKKLKATNKDKDGIFEASVRKNLLSIMKRYSLDNYYDDIHPLKEGNDTPPQAWLQGNTADVKFKGDEDLHHKSLKMTFKDKRLNKLWRKAEESNSFNEEQLMLLYEELQHQQDKLDEHYDIMNSLENTVNGGRASKLDKSWDNSIEADMDESIPSKRSKNESAQKPKKVEKKAKLNGHFEQSLHDDYKSIRKNIDNLQDKVLNGKPVGDSEFEFKAVDDLWISAKEANFSQKELDSLKEELEHFQTRIKKLHHFQSQLERRKLNLDEYNYKNDEDKHIKKRVEELSHKVDKAHRSIEAKISSRRDEL